MSHVLPCRESASCSGLPGVRSRAELGGLVNDRPLQLLQLGLVVLAGALGRQDRVGGLLVGLVEGVRLSLSLPTAMGVLMRDVPLSWDGLCSHTANGSFM